MGSYVANTPQEQQAMLQEAGFQSFDDMFSCIPDEVRLKGSLKLPAGKSELEVSRQMRALAEQNRVFPTMFRGAGAYCHYIPAIVKSITSREEFVTAYTPYQAEISQGILQGIFEYQTMICMLTGMAAANASVYDGATAAAEAAAMCRERKRSNVVCMSEGVHPEVQEVVRTYCFGSGSEVVMVPLKDGVTDTESLRQQMDEEASCFLVQQPNYYGNIEPAAALGEIAHAVGAKYIMSGNPMAMAVLKTPAEYGADIAVGDGQPLGLPLGMGGPYIGFMASTQAMMRKLPGRLVGETKDVDGRRAYVLTLQAREQHIRREKASSNICSNQEWCALTVAAYLAAMGSDGLRQAASQCMAKAHYLQQALAGAGLALKYPQAFFHEFVTTSEASSAAILKELEAQGILGGLPLSEHEILWCATEMNTKEEMDRTVQIVREVCGK